MTDKELREGFSGFLPEASSYEAITVEEDKDHESHVVLTQVEVEWDKKVPEFQSSLRNRIVEVPHEIYKASGIKVFGKRIKSLLFSTDVALIRNSNAGSVIAVYPFTPQSVIMQAIISCASVPVFVGVGGGLTTGQRSVNLAFQAEQLGAYGVVVNAPMAPEVIAEIKAQVDVPVIATISSFADDFMAKKEAGADMFNVSGGSKTVELVRHLRHELGPEFPIIATGGPNGESILATIEAGANAITYTPPTTADIFATVMDKYRDRVHDDEARQEIVDEEATK
ncbi:hydrolase [Vaginisenegalia massiliensis]|uniref:hydrolase n=1 Tax=Vaginisenegalia massiliensis TaxID=2058294 RepID=UPI001F14FBD6|nr:hydrolase [Vaginisenegalia massiliensis]